MNCPGPLLLSRSGAYPSVTNPGYTSQTTIPALMGGSNSHHSIQFATVNTIRANLTSVSRGSGELVSLITDRNTMLICINVVVVFG